MKIEDMSPEEEQEYMAELNEAFELWVEPIPFVEIGDTTDGQKLKLRQPHIKDEGNLVFTIIYELQRMLWMHQRSYPKKNITKMVVGKIELTPEFNDPSFNPIRGFMVEVYYKKPPIEPQRYIQPHKIEHGRSN